MDVLRVNHIEKEFEYNNQFLFENSNLASNPFAILFHEFENFFLRKLRGTNFSK